MQKKVGDAGRKRLMTFEDKATKTQQRINFQRLFCFSEWDRWKSIFLIVMTFGIKFGNSWNEKALIKFQFQKPICVIGVNFKATFLSFYCEYKLPSKYHDCFWNKTILLRDRKKYTDLGVTYLLELKSGRAGGLSRWGGGGWWAWGMGQVLGGGMGVGGDGVRGMGRYGVEGWQAGTGQGWMGQMVRAAGEWGWFRARGKGAGMGRGDRAGIAFLVVFHFVIGKMGSFIWWSVVDPVKIAKGTGQLIGIVSADVTKSPWKLTIVFFILNLILVDLPNLR